MEHLSGSAAAGPIWHAVMMAAHKGIAPHTFSRPPGIRTIRLCLSTGLPLSAQPGCSAVKEDWAIEGTSFAWAESPDVLYRALQQARRTDEAPPSGSVSSSSEVDIGVPGLALLSPAPQARFARTPGLPAEEQAIPLEIDVPEGSQMVVWVDGRRVGTRSTPPYRIWWPLRPGAHTVRFEVHLPDGRTKTLTTSFEVTEKAVP